MAALDDRLPAELPVKDGAAQLQLNDVPLEAMIEELALDEDGMIKELVGLPWEFIVNKQARQEWAGMDRTFRWAATTLPMHRCSHEADARWILESTHRQLTYIAQATTLWCLQTQPRGENLPRLFDCTLPIVNGAGISLCTSHDGETFLLLDGSQMMVDMSG